MSKPLDYATPLLNRERTALLWRKRLQLWLISAAMMLFAISLTLPAATAHGGMGTTGPVYGYFWALLAIYFYPSNLFLLLLPLWRMWAVGRMRPRLQVGLASISLASTSFVMLIAFEERLSSSNRSDYIHLLIGGYLWVTAHSLATLGLLIPVSGDPPVPTPISDELADPW